MSCPSGKIRNPVTGRCVSKEGKIGKSLLKGKTSPRKSSKSRKSKKVTVSNDCTPDKIKNPSTGRCVSRTGAIGKKLVVSSKKVLIVEEKDDDDESDESEQDDESEDERDKEEDYYAACYNQECGKESHDGYFNIVTLPKGAKIFRNMRTKLKSKNPTWFSDPKIAEGYGEEGYSCNVFSITKDLNLIDVTISKNIKRIYESDKISGADKEIISLVTGYDSTSLTPPSFGKFPEIYCSGGYKNKSKSKLMFCPVGFFSAKDKKKNIYLNLRLAKIVCKMGYDGWIIPPKKVIDGYTGSMYTHEVLICNPKQKLKQIKNESCTDY